MSSFESYFQTFKSQSQEFGLWRSRKISDEGDQKSSNKNINSFLPHEANDHFSSLIDFCSNDYLGFQKDSELHKKIYEKLEDLPNGSGSSPLIRGYSQSTQDLEEHLAERSASESALFFTSGYLANLSFFSSFAKSNTEFFSDQENHASIIDGIRLSGSTKSIFKHNSISDLVTCLERSQSSLKIVVVESIYSMSGDYAPLLELAKVCEDFGALLVVDEAHATGYYGVRGSGRVEALGLEKKIFARIHTAGKALGVGGAWISGSESLIHFLVNRARPYIYSTASHPFAIHRLKQALDFWDQVGASRILQSQMRLKKITKFLGLATDENNIGPIVSISSF